MAVQPLDSGYTGQSQEPGIRRVVLMPWVAAASPVGDLDSKYTAMRKAAEFWL